MKNSSAETGRNQCIEVIVVLQLFVALNLALVLVTPAFALQELKEDQMAKITGAGLAFAFDDFSFRMAPTSYAELTGSQPSSQASAAGWQRGDARYYGISMTSASGAGMDWYGNGCTNNFGMAGCPMGMGEGSYGVTAFASVYDPYMLRVFEYEGFDYSGGLLADGGDGPMPSILEFRGPAQTDPWRWSFWGELEVNRDTTSDLDSRVVGLPSEVAPSAPNRCNSAGSSSGGCSGTSDFLQSQTIIGGQPSAQGLIWDSATDTYSARPEGRRRSIQRWMFTSHDDATFGVAYDSALSGDFRFSVRQTNASPDALHIVPDFDDNEGLYFRNVDAFLPLGTLHYQALTFSGVSEFDQNGNKLASPVQNGNFAIELTRIPNEPNVYSHFYAGVTDGSCENATTSTSCKLAADGSISNPNPDTHGYVRWGNWPGVNGATAFPGATSTDNGIFFVGGCSGVPCTAPSSAPVNIGVARIEGMLIQHMRITSLGAGVN